MHIYVGVGVLGQGEDLLVPGIGRGGVLSAVAKVLDDNLQAGQLFDYPFELLRGEGSHVGTLTTDGNVQFGSLPPDGQRIAAGSEVLNYTLAQIHQLQKDSVL